MVHTPEGSLEVGVCSVDVVLGEFRVLLHHDVGAETIVDLSVCAESVCCVTEDALSLCCVGADVGEDGCPEFQDAVHECDWSIA